MEKFSNYSKPVEVKIDIRKESDVISQLVDYSITTQVTNEDLTTKQITLEGKDEFISKIMELIEEEKTKAVSQVKENIRIKFNNVVDIEYINESLKNLDKIKKNI